MSRADRAASQEPRRRLSFGTVSAGLDALGTVWIFALMVLIVADVVGRTVFLAPIPGVTELVKLSIVGIVFLQVGHTLRAGRITRTDMMIGRLRRRMPRVGHAVEVVFHLAGATVFALIFEASLPFFERSITAGENVGTHGYFVAPVWPVRLIILVGSAVAALEFLIAATSHLMVALGRRAPSDADTDRPVA